MTAIEKVKQIQKLLGVEIDGDPGPKTEAAWKALKLEAKVFVPKKAKASSFADPADIEAFERCKKTGKTDKQCFAVGDNGIGQFGAITAQAHTPMCALHSSDMIARWGSVKDAAHRQVSVKANGTTIQCAVEDRMSAPGRIDLNPAAARMLGLTPPFLVDCEWTWA